MFKYINCKQYDKYDMRYHLLEYSEIVTGLFVGSRKILDLYQDKVYMIVNCTKDIPFPDKPDIIEYIRIPMDQDPDTRNSDTTSYTSIRKNTFMYSRRWYSISTLFIRFTKIMYNNCIIFTKIS